MSESSGPGVTKVPCNDCPFRRVATPGWLGAYEGPEEFLHTHITSGASRPPCHQTIDYTNPDWVERQLPTAPTCAGAAIFMNNYIKLPYDSEFARATKCSPTDRSTVFTTPEEFVAHHSRRELTPDEAAMVARFRRLQ